MTDSDIPYEVKLDMLLPFDKGDKGGQFKHKQLNAVVVWRALLEGDGTKVKKGFDQASCDCSLVDMVYVATRQMIGEIKYLLGDEECADQHWQSWLDVDFFADLIKAGECDLIKEKRRVFLSGNLDEELSVLKSKHSYAENHADLLGSLNSKKMEYEKFRARMRYGSLVGKQANFMYVETPKAACSSVKWLLASLEGNDVPVTQYGRESSLQMGIHYRHGLKSLMDFGYDEINRLLYSDSVVRFCIIRNPYARLASAWANKIRQKEPGYSLVWDKINSFSGDGKISCPTFREFVFWLVANRNKEKNVHWATMYSLLMPNLIDYTYTVRLEDFDLHFLLNLYPNLASSDLLDLINNYRTNDSIPYNWKDLYDEEIAGLVSLMFKEDFDFYGYKLDSWMKKDELGRQDYDYMLDIMEKTALDLVRDRNDVIFSLTS